MALRGQKEKTAAAREKDHRRKGELAQMRTGRKKHTTRPPPSPPKPDQAKPQPSVRRRGELALLLEEARRFGSPAPADGETKSTAAEARVSLRSAAKKASATPPSAARKPVAKRKRPLVADAKSEDLTDLDEGELDDLISGRTPVTPTEPKPRTAKRARLAAPTRKSSRVAARLKAVAAAAGRDGSTASEATPVTAATAAKPGSRKIKKQPRRPAPDA